MIRTATSCASAACRSRVIRATPAKLRSGFASGIAPKQNIEQFRHSEKTEMLYALTRKTAPAATTSQPSIIAQPPVGAA